jgi:hopanoid biosynthesis associated protein HpnK
MVAAPAAADAVRRAARLPNLRVGLHLVLADGQAVLEPSHIPDLADRNGKMDSRMLAKGVGIFLLPRMRRQLEAEIRAQFLAFERTGLKLDHVNVHKHFHIHPTVLQVLLRVAREFGRPPVRLPAEPLWFAFRPAPVATGIAAVLISPWISLMRRRLRAAGVRHNDAVFGIAASGAMDEATLLQIITRLPQGVTEIYLHPATESGAAIAPTMPGYRHADELAALLSPRVRAALAESGANCGGFSDCRGAGLES